MRYEYKYVINKELLLSLRQMTAPFTEIDKHAKHLLHQQYTVRSIYYDTPDLAMFHAKTEHLSHRLKVRIRGYNEYMPEKEVFFEIKRKYQGPIVKNRAKIRFEDAVKLMQNSALEEFEINTENSDNLKRFFYQLYSKRLQPLINIIYEREPFIGKVNSKNNDFRMTIDKNLRVIAHPKIEQLFSDEGTSLVMPEQFILEIKFNLACPEWVKPILAKLAVEKVPASKYVMCIEHLGLQNQLFKSFV
ncbi:MAG: polyphosphate polymerase domain-containing protein [Saprospiraceae bacterium]